MNTGGSTATGGASSGGDAGFGAMAGASAGAVGSGSGGSAGATNTGGAPNTGGSSYFVTTNGNDSNDGRSEAKAFKTIQVGVDKLEPGETLYVKAGNYGAQKFKLSKQVGSSRCSHYG